MKVIDNELEARRWCPACEQWVMPVSCWDDDNDILNEHTLIDDMEGDIIMACPQACPVCGATGFDHMRPCHACGYDLNEFGKRIAARVKQMIAEAAAAVRAAGEEGR